MLNPFVGTAGKDLRMKGWKTGEKSWDDANLSSWPQKYQLRSSEHAEIKWSSLVMSSDFRRVLEAFIAEKPVQPI